MGWLIDDNDENDDDSQDEIKYYQGSGTNSKDRDSTVEPSEKDVMRKKVRGIRMGYNDIFAIGNKMRRLSDLAKEKMGMHPEEGDEVMVKFDNGKKIKYTVVRTSDRWDLFSDPDRFRFHCELTDSWVDREKYPEQISLGSTTGQFEVMERSDED